MSNEIRKGQITGQYIPQDFCPGGLMQYQFDQLKENERKK